MLPTFQFIDHENGRWSNSSIFIRRFMTCTLIRISKDMDASYIAKAAAQKNPARKMIPGRIFYSYKKEAYFLTTLK